MCLFNFQNFNMATVNLENEVQQLNKNLYIYKMATEQLMLQRSQQTQELRRLREENELLSEEVKKHSVEKKNWSSLDVQYNEVITTLADQLRKMDNDNTKLLESNRKLTEKSELHLKQCKTLKKNSRHLKRLKRHIRETNTVLDDVICNGDCILSDIENN